jgi:hypothetical protein
MKLHVWPKEGIFSHKSFPVKDLSLFSVLYGFLSLHEKSYLVIIH